MVCSLRVLDVVNGIASQVAQRVSGLSIEQMGGVGFTRELGIEKYWRY